MFGAYRTGVEWRLPLHADVNGVQLERARAIGLEAYLDEQLNPELINDSAMQGASEVSDIGALGGGGEAADDGGEVDGVETIGAVEARSHNLETDEVVLVLADDGALAGAAASRLVQP